MRVLSLFAGIGGFDEAFRRAGAELVGAVELDPACRRVLEVRFPGVPLWSDVRAVHAATDCPNYRGHWCPFCGEQGRTGHASDCKFSGRLRCADCLPAVDVLVGGWPCQPFSVAGRRRGTDDERDLWPEFARLVGELRPRWVVGENVPGLLSIDEGRVWARTVADLSDLGYGVAWRVLDAQFFGVPQRRRRIFLVASAGDLAGPAQILLDSEGSGRDLAARRTAGQEAASPIGNGVAHARGGGGEPMHTLTASASKMASEDGTGRGAHVISVTLASDPITADDLAMPQTGRNGDPGVVCIAAPLTAGSHNSHAPGRRMEDDVNLAVVNTLTSHEGGPDDNTAAGGGVADLSGPLGGHHPRNDLDSHGTYVVTEPLPIQDVSREKQQNGSGIGEEGAPAYTLDGASAPAIAYSIDAQAWSRTGDAETLSPDAHGNMRLRPPGLGIHEEVSPTVNSSLPHAVAFALRADPGGVGQGHNTNYVSVAENQRGEVREGDTFNLTAGGGKPGQGYPAMSDGMTVRRLMPVEMERLQGFPDSWTDVDGASDSQRAKQLGNAVAVPVVEWIARRLLAYEESINP